MLQILICASHQGSRTAVIGGGERVYRCEELAGDQKAGEVCREGSILETTSDGMCRVSDPDDARAIPEPDRYSALPVKVSDAECGVPDSIES